MVLVECPDPGWSHHVRKQLVDIPVLRPEHDLPVHGQRSTTAHDLLPSGTTEPNKATEHQSPNNVQQCPKCMCEGLSFSRAPKHEHMHLSCMYHVRHQSKPCPPIHACSAPSAKRVATKCASTQSELRATVNCRVGSYRSTGNWLRLFIQGSPRPAVHQTVASQ